MYFCSENLLLVWKCKWGTVPAEAEHTSDTQRVHGAAVAHVSWNERRLRAETDCLRVERHAVDAAAQKCAGRAESGLSLQARTAHKLSSKADIHIRLNPRCSLRCRKSTRSPISTVSALCANVCIWNVPSYSAQSLLRCRPGVYQRQAPASFDIRSRLPPLLPKLSTPSQWHFSIDRRSQRSPIA